MIRTPAMLLLLLPLLPLSPASIASAACQDSWMICSGYVSHALATSDATGQLDCSLNNLHSTMSFDVPAGRANADAMSVAGFYNVCQLIDDYTVTGVPEGTALSVTAVADLDLLYVRVAGMSPTFVFGSLWVSPVVGAPNPNIDEFYFAGAAPGEETQTHQLRLALPVLAGTPFPLSLSVGVSASGRQGGYSHARLSFEGLPPGARIASCKGYHQDQPVPALARSWGAVKATYR